MRRGHAGLGETLVSTPERKDPLMLIIILAAFAIGAGAVALLAGSRWLGERAVREELSS